MVLKAFARLLHSFHKLRDGIGYAVVFTTVDTKYIGLDVRDALRRWIVAGPGVTRKQGGRASKMFKSTLRDAEAPWFGF
jgi:hypothetical protein